MRKIYNYILPVLLALSTASCGNDDAEVVYLTNQEPVVTIENISPSKGYIGNEFSITGSNFGIVASDVKVLIGEKEARILSCEDGVINAKVVEGTTAGRLSVIVYGQRVETKFMYDVLGAPGVMEVVPPYGFVGDKITFKGHDLGVASTFYKVLFNGKEESALFSSEPEDESFTVQVPAGAKSGAISLEISGQEVTVSPQFTVLERATLNKLLPEQGFGGSELTITGTNLTADLLEDVEDLKGIEVYFRKGMHKYGPAELIGAATKEEIKVKVPAGLEVGNYSVSVNTAFETIEKVLAYKVISTPVVTNVTPSKGYVGMDVTIITSDLDVSVEDIEVKFGTALAKDVKLNEAGNIVVKVPSDAVFGKVNLSLSVLGAEIQLGDHQVFTVLASPVIRSITSDNVFNNKAVQIGNTITISGQGFKSSSIKEMVYNGAPLEANVVSDTQITATILESCETGKGAITLKFEDVLTDVVSEDKLNMLKTGSDISEYVLKNGKQPFKGVGDTFTNKDGIWTTPVDWEFNKGAGNDGFYHHDGEYPVDGLFFNDQNSDGLLIIQSGWSGRPNKVNGKMFQTIELPHGTYQIALNVVEFNATGGGRKKAGFFVTKGEGERIPDLSDNGSWMNNLESLISSIDFTKEGEVYSNKRLMTAKDVVVDYDGSTTLGFAVQFASGNRSLKISSIEILLK